MLRSKKTYPIHTIDGVKELTIYAELINPQIDNQTKTIIFTSCYFVEYAVTVKEAIPEEVNNLGQLITHAIPAQIVQKKLEIHRNTEKYTEATIEDLYATIKPLLPITNTYFEAVNNPIYFAFGFVVRNGNFFGLAGNEWEEVSND